MKLNLLPKSLSKQKGIKRAYIGLVLLSLAGIGLSLFFIITSKASLDDAKKVVAEKEPEYQRVDATAKSADTLIAQAVPFVRNIDLYKQMLAHNTVYPDAYDFVRKYIPGFYRVNSMTLTPVSEKDAQLTLVGTLKTRQEYDDLLLALSRIPGQTQVGRSAFTPDERDFIPNLTAEDPIGRRRKRSEPAIPKDIEGELAQQVAKGSVTGFQGVGEFGSQDDNPRGAMPKYQVITSTVIFPRELRVALPKATVAKSGAAPAAAAAAPTATPAAAAAPAGAAPGAGQGRD